MSREPDDAGGRGGRPVTAGQPPPGAGWTRYEPKTPFAADDDLEFEHRRSTRHGGPGRRRRLLGYLLVALFALVLGPGVGYARAYFLDGAVGATVTVVVKEGASLRAIAAQLESKGVVKHARAFVIKADADGYATRFMPGTLHVPRQHEPYRSARG